MILQKSLRRLRELVMENNPSFREQDYQWEMSRETLTLLREEAEAFDRLTTMASADPSYSGIPIVVTPSVSIGLVSLTPKEATP